MKSEQHTEHNTSHEQPSNTHHEKHAGCCFTVAKRRFSDAFCVFFYAKALLWDHLQSAKSWEFKGVVWWESDVATVG